MSSKVPARTCVGCRARAAKSELLRVVAVAVPNGYQLRLDPRAQLPGRGAYLHPTAACVEQAVRRRALLRALRVTQPLDVSPLTDLVHGSANDAAQAAQRRRSDLE